MKWLYESEFADFIMLSCNAECQMKELAKMDQIVQCNVKNIKDAAFFFHYEDAENG